MFSKVAQIDATAVLHFQNSPKSHQYVWATFVSEFDAKNFKKSPNLVTLIRPNNASQYEKGFSGIGSQFWCSSNHSFSFTAVDQGRKGQTYDHLIILNGPNPDSFVYFRLFLNKMTNTVQNLTRVDGVLVT